MNEYVRSIITAKETVTLGIVEPLDGAFQSIHVRPPLFCGISKRRDSEALKCLGIVLLSEGPVKAWGERCKSGSKEGSY
jgi:hypothetical protein